MPVEEQIALEWEANPLSDMIADTIALTTL